MSAPPALSHRWITRLLPPSIEPKLKTKQRPKRFAMVGLTGPMLIQQAAHEGHIKDTLPPQLFFTQSFIH
jgi:hypothetical protein